VGTAADLLIAVAKTSFARAGWSAAVIAPSGGVGMLYSNPSIDTLAVVISVGHRISVRPFATAIFCVPLTE
jgi:hypothetical protein